MENIYYIYYAIQNDDTPKIGITKNVYDRIKRTNYKTIKLLEAYTEPQIAGDREIELQLKYFGKRDSNMHYANSFLFNKRNKKVWNENGQRAIDTGQLAEARKRGGGINKTIKKGELNGHCRLTEEIVRYILTSDLENIELARMYGVTTQNICNIRKRKTWKHITI